MKHFKSGSRTNLFAIVAYTTLTAQFAFGQCPSLDLRKAIPQNVQPRFKQTLDQGNSGLCYANVAADLLSWHSETSVSAIALAMQYNSELTAVDQIWRTPEGDEPESRIIPDGGRIELALRQALREFEICTERSIPSFDQAKLKKSVWIVDEAKKKRPSEAELRDAVVDSRLTRFFPNLTDTDLVSEIFPGKRPDWISILTNLTLKSCEKAIPELSTVRLLKVKSQTSDIERGILKNWQRSIPAPQAMLITSDELYAEKEDSGWIGSVFGDHVVSVWGSRPSTSQVNSCDFLVRDSFGRDCAIYSDYVSCNGDGTFWISGAKLKDISHRLVSLE